MVVPPAEARAAVGREGGVFAKSFLERRAEVIVLEHHALGDGFHDVGGGLLFLLEDGIEEAPGNSGIGRDGYQNVERDARGPLFHRHDDGTGGEGARLVRLLDVELHSMPSFERFFVPMRFD